MMTKDQSNSLADQLRALHPHSERGAAEPSEARKYVRDHFDVIAAARERQLTWPQITQVLVDNGVKAADGAELEWRTLKSLFHAERYVKGGRRKRRPKKVSAQPVTQAPISAPPPFDPTEGTTDDRPRPKFGPARPR